MLVTFTLSEPHEIRRIENSVEDKMGIEKIGESDINFWLHSLDPLLLFATFAVSSFPILKDVFLNGLAEYDCFESFRLKRLHGNHALEYFKLRAFNLSIKWNWTTSMSLFSLLNKDLHWSVLTIHCRYFFLKG